MPRLPRTALLAACTATAAALLGVLLVTTNSPGAAKASPMSPVASQPIPAVDDLTLALYRMGLDPRSLTAAGVSASETVILVNSAQVQLVSNPGMLQAADMAYNAARAERETLQHRVQSGVGSQLDVAAYNAAQSAFVQAETSRTNILNTLFTTATAGLDEGKVNILSTIKANRGWELPLEFLTVSRPESEWLALRSALANERISANRGDAPDPASQALLQSLRSNPTVAAAMSNLAANLAAVSAAWQQAAAE